jgi:hypothetical protein
MNGDAARLEMPDVNKFDAIFWTLPYEQQVREALKTLKTVAMVGLSDDPMRDSYMVGAYLKKAGFKIIPVNPRVPMVLGEKAYPDLASARKGAGEIDIIDIFRAPEFIPRIVEEAIKIDAKMIWMQLDLEVESAAEAARAAGMFVVMNRCMKIEHMKIIS